MPRSTAVESFHSMRRLDIGVDINRLVEIKLPIRSPSQRVNHVVSVFSAERGEHDSLLIRFAVPIRILEMKQFRALTHIRAAITWNNRGGNEKFVGKHSRFFGIAIPIGIF